MFDRFVLAEDLIEIQEVTLLKGEKWEDSTYSVQASILDGVSIVQMIICKS